jgi:tellurite resistance protein
MPFGKFRGYNLEDLPDHYLKWLLFDADFVQGQLLSEIQDEVERRWPCRMPTVFTSDFRCEAVDSQKLKSVYRKLAVQFHPDKGGYLEAMKAINLFYEMMQEATSGY